MPGKRLIKSLNSSPLFKTAGFFSLKRYRIFKDFKKTAPQTLKALYLYLSYNPLSFGREFIHA